MLLIFCTKEACHSILLDWRAFKIWLMLLELMVYIYQLLLIMKLGFHFLTRRWTTLKSCWKILKCNGPSMVVLSCQMHGLIKSKYVWLIFWWTLLQRQCLWSPLMAQILWRQMRNCLRCLILGKIGEENVVQVITDNGNNYVLAGKLLEEKRHNLY